MKYLILAFSICLISCGHDKQINDEYILKKFIKDKFDLDISDSLNFHLYVSPEIYCEGCFSYMLDSFYKDESSKYIMITQRTYEFNKNILNDVNEILIDTSRLLNNLRLSEKGTILYEFNEGEISNSFNFNTENIENYILE